MGKKATFILRKGREGDTKKTTDRWTDLVGEGGRERERERVRGRENGVDLLTF